MANKKSFSKKFKYGAFATILTVAFIVAVILFNVVVSALQSKFNFNIDFTKENVFSVSDSSVELVNNQIENSKKENNTDSNIKITFLSARDKIVANEQYSWIVNLAESYAEKIPEISVEFKEDYYSHPENYSYYTELGYSIDSTKIIVSNATSKASFKIFNFDSCLVFDENGTDVWAFKGEMMFNSAIIAITSKSIPVVAFTTGHGESKPEYLVDTFLNSGFSVKDVDLSKDKLTDDIKLLVISNPVSDIIAVENDDESTEYTVLSDYLNDYRNLMVIANPSTPQLPVLDEILDSWGLKLIRNQIIMDDSSSVPGNNQMLYLDYFESENVSAALTETLTNVSNPARCVTNKNAPIKITNNGDGSVFGVEPVLTSSANSYIETVDGEGNIEKITGPFNTMAISTRYTIQNNTDIYGHILLIGSTDFTEISTYKSQYGNTELMNNAIRLLTNESIKVELNYKVLDDYELSDVEISDVIFYGVFSAVVIPLVIFAVCVVVYIKRKHM